MNVSSARRLLADFRRFAGPRLLLLWLLMAAGALAEGFGIVMLVPLLALAGNPAGVPGMLLPLFALVPSSLGLSTFVAAVLLFLLLMGLRSLLIYARDVPRIRATLRAWPTDNWDDSEQMHLYRLNLMRSIGVARFARWLREGARDAD